MLLPGPGPPPSRYGAGDQLLDESETAGTTLTTMARTEYIWLGGEVIGLIYTNNATQPTATVYHVHADRVGVPRQYSTSTGGRVSRLILDAFGGSIVTDDNGAGPNPPMNMRYPGQMFDAETGLINNRWRTMVPQTGTYTSADPRHRRTVARHHGPQSYTYGSHRPFFYVDPDGRELMLSPRCSQVYQDAALKMKDTAWKLLNGCEHCGLAQDQLHQLYDAIAGALTVYVDCAPVSDLGEYEQCGTTPPVGPQGQGGTIVVVPDPFPGPQKAGGISIDACGPGAGPYCVPLSQVDTGRGDNPCLTMGVGRSNAGERQEA